MFALVFVVAFGLGPLPGVLAIAIHSAGALGKQFFETTENIDPKPIEGLRSVGASYIEMVRFAAVPQVLASFSTFALLRFEINVRGATVLGFVGAGGIGQDLMEAIRKFYYSDVSAILVMIIAVVMTLDISTQYLRRALIGEGAMMSPQSAVALDLAAVRQRYPQFFGNPWRRRAKALAGVAVMAAIYLGAFIYFDVPWARLGPGLMRLIWFVGEMFPPDRRRPSCDLSQRARRDAGDLPARHADRRRVRAAARHSRRAQRHPGRVDPFADQALVRRRARH